MWAGGGTCDRTAEWKPAAAWTRLRTLQPRLWGSTRFNALEDHLLLPLLLHASLELVQTAHRSPKLVQHLLLRQSKQHFLRSGPTAVAEGVELNANEGLDQLCF